MNVVILAAGHGSRMQSDIPKVLHRLGGRPLLAHVLDTARALNPATICMVYGYGGEAVPNAMKAESSTVIWVRQDPQLGTGHAVLQAMPHLDTTVPTLVLYGDVPMISVDTLRALAACAGSGLGILTVELERPAGYGRIVRDGNRITGIVEEKDADETEKGIKEINTGVMIAPTTLLGTWLSKLSNKNAQGEYYLTDIVAMASQGGTRIGSAKAANTWEASGVNTKTQLAELERLRRSREAQTLLEKGITLVDPARIDIRGRLDCGRDCEIDVNCVFEGDVVLADRVSVGPNCILRNVNVASDTRIEAYCHLDDAQIGSNCRIGPYARLRPGTKLSQNVHI